MIIVKIILVFNFFLILSLPFYENKDYTKFIKWTLACTFLPLLGYAFYIVFGNKLKFFAKEQLLKTKLSTTNFIKLTNIGKNFNISSSIFTYSSLKIFNNTALFLRDLIDAINGASKSICIEMYIFSDDRIGNLICRHLIEKARVGVKVRIVYDSFGSRKMSPTFWQKLKDAGIEVCEFFPPLANSGFLNTKINYRNHRKIIIIDGKTSYIGGVNFRDDHFGLSKKLKPWQDSMIKLEGYVTSKIMDTFLNDFIFASGKNLSAHEISMLFPKCTIKLNNPITLKILNGNPIDEQNSIFLEYSKQIDKASKFIVILTPYFILNPILKEKLLNALNRGVKLYIFIPKKPDKSLVYARTIDNLKPLMFNFKHTYPNVYLFNGFLHSKAFLTEKVLCLGSANFDSRSLGLNFENVCVCYNKDIITKYFNYVCTNLRAKSAFLSRNRYKKLRAKYLLLLLISKPLSDIL